MASQTPMDTFDGPRLTTSPAGIVSTFRSISQKPTMGRVSLYLCVTPSAASAG